MEQSKEKKLYKDAFFSSIKYCKVGLKRNKTEMILGGIIDKHLTSNELPLLLTHVPISFREVDHYYLQLLEFVANSCEPYKSQLVHFLFPLFVHCYLELIYYDFQEDSKKFYSSYCEMFLQVEEFRNNIDALSNIHTKEDVNNDRYFNNFRLNKFVFQITEDCLEYLKGFLKIKSNLFLLKFLQSYFAFEFIDINEEIHENASAFSRKNLLFEEFVEKEILQKDSPEKLAAPTCDTPEIASLKAIINKLSKGPKSFPPTLLYRIISKNPGICSVELSLDNSLVAASFENSSIYIWPLKSDVKKPKHSLVNSLYDEMIDLDDSTYSDEITLTLQNTKIYGLKFSACRKLLFSCGNDTLITAWDTKQMRSAAVYMGHTYTIWDMDVSPSTLYMASASKDATACIWKPDRNYPLRVFTGHLSDVDCVKFHPNCNYIATGSKDKTVRLWDLVSGKMVRSFISHKSNINCLAFSPDGNYLVSAGDDFSINIWDISTSKIVKQFCGHTDSIYCLSFNENGSILVSGGMEDKLYIWDINKSISSRTYLPKEESGANIYNSPELIDILPTTETSLHLLRFTQQNLLMAIGKSYDDSLIKERKVGWNQIPYTLKNMYFIN